VVVYYKVAVVAVCRQANAGNLPVISVPVKRASTSRQPYNGASPSAAIICKATSPIPVD